MALLITVRLLGAEMVMVSVFEAALVFPLLSVIDPAATRTDPFELSEPAGVNETVRVRPEAVSEDNVPRVVLKSESVRSLTLSLNVMVIVQDVPAA